MSPKWKLILSDRRRLRSFPDVIFFSLSSRRLLKEKRTNSHSPSFFPSHPLSPFPSGDFSLSLFLLLLTLLLRRKTSLNNIHSLNQLSTQFTLLFNSVPCYHHKELLLKNQSSRKEERVEIVSWKYGGESHDE